MVKMGKVFKGKMLNDNVILVVALLLLIITVLYCESYIISNMEHFMEADKLIETENNSLLNNEKTSSLGADEENALSKTKTTTTLSVPFTTAPQMATSVSNESAQKYPPCPPCARCPEPAFECKKVPTYSNLNFTNKWSN